MSEQKKRDVPPAQRVEDIPDPDEDDLDDLDDVLDEFSATKIEDKPAASQPSVSKSPAPSTATAEEDDFAKRLQAGMAELLGELGNSPEMMKQFEDLVKDLGNASGEQSGQGGVPATESSASGTSAPSSSNTSEDTFQEQIRKTMERMATSGQQADEAAAKGDSTDNILAAMLAEMERGGFSSDNIGSDEDFSKMLMGMMEQLTNKDILHEPMKELDDKFPGWLEKNHDKVGKEDLVRYKEQRKLVREITARFEAPGYSDSSAEDREYIVERMQKMQAAGSPPPDLVGDMNAAQEALGDLESGCATQ